MARRAPSIVFLLTILVMGCSKDTGQAEEPSVVSPPVAEALDESVLKFDTTGQAVFATHRDTGYTFLLFEDETFEDSEEGTVHRLLYSFGAYVSYSREWHYEGGAHPSYGQSYHAVAVTDTLADADLRDLFSTESIYAALQQTALAHQTPLDHTTLDDLLAGLATTYECEMSFDDFFSSFFVDEIEGDTAMVVVGLTHGCEVQRGNFTTLALRLPLSEQTRAMVADHRRFFVGLDNPPSAREPSP